MKASYVPKRKPGRPSKPPQPEIVSEKEEKQDDVIEPITCVPLTLQEQALDFLKAENFYLPDEISQDLLPAIIYHRCGSISMHNYFREKNQPTLQSFVRWLTHTNQIHFDKVPIPGDPLFLHNTGSIMACRLVLSVKEEEVSLPSLYPSFPTYLHPAMERARAGLKKKYTVTLHNWHEPVTSWYAIGKIVD